MSTELKAVKTASEDELLTLPFATKTIRISGKSFTFRELSVEENDNCADAARTENGGINGRTMMRLMIIASATDPKLSADMLAKMPQRAYIRIYDTVNDLNTITVDEDIEEEGKD